MTVRIAVIAAAVCVLGLVAVPAKAEPLVFTVSADTAASARFYLATDTTLSFDQAQITTSADYSGLALYSDDGRLQGGILAAPALSFANHDLDAVYLGPPTATYRHGWYRVVVLANTATTVRIPVVSGTGMTVTATTPNGQTYRVLTKTLPPSGPITAELRAPLARATATTRVALLARLSPAVVDGKITLVACASQRAKPCAGRDTKTTLTSDKSGPNATRVVQAGISTAGRSLAGTRDALARVTLTPLASVPFSFLALRWTDPAR